MASFLFSERSERCRRLGGPCSALKSYRVETIVAEANVAVDLQIAVLRKCLVNAVSRSAGQANAASGEAYGRQLRGFDLQPDTERAHNFKHRCKARIAVAAKGFVKTFA